MNAVKDLTLRLMKAEKGSRSHRKLVSEAKALLERVEKNLLRKYPTSRAGTPLVRHRGTLHFNDQGICVELVTKKNYFILEPSQVEPHLALPVLQALPKLCAKVKAAPVEHST